MEPELGHIRLTKNASVSVMGRGVFGAIPESGSASESQSQNTRHEYTEMSVYGKSSCYKSRHLLCKVFLPERLLTVSVANTCTDSDLISCQLYSINTLNDETLGAYGI